MESMFTILISLIIVLAVWLLMYRLMRMKSKEGLATASVENGVAGNAATYAAAVKTAAVKIQDTLLIPKYRSQYEDTVINMNDFISASMLNTVVHMNTQDPGDDVKKLVELQLAKNALDSVMKYLDAT